MKKVLKFVFQPIVKIVALIKLKSRYSILSFKMQPSRWGWLDQDSKSPQLVGKFKILLIQTLYLPYYSNMINFHYIVVLDHIFYALSSTLKPPRASQSLSNDFFFFLPFILFVCLRNDHRSKFYSLQPPALLLLELVSPVALLQPSNISVYSITFY